MKVQIFIAGNGDRFALVSREGSGQVVVFKWHAESWVGTCEFNRSESAGIWPGYPNEATMAAIKEAGG